MIHNKWWIVSLNMLRLEVFISSIVHTDFVNTHRSWALFDKKRNTLYNYLEFEIIKGYGHNG